MEMNLRDDVQIQKKKKLFRFRYWERLGKGDSRSRMGDEWVKEMYQTLLTVV